MPRQARKRWLWLRQFSCNWLRLAAASLYASRVGYVFCQGQGARSDPGDFVAGLLG
jgi:hypothetical protein